MGTSSPRKTGANDTFGSFFDNVCYHSSYVFHKSLINIKSYYERLALTLLAYHVAQINILLALALMCTSPAERILRQKIWFSLPLRLRYYQQMCGSKSHSEIWIDSLITASVTSRQLAVQGDDSACTSPCC